MSPAKRTWIVEIRYPRSDVVQTDQSGYVTGLVWGRWWTKSGPFATEDEARKEAEIVTRIEKEARSGAEVRFRRAAGKDGI